MRSFNFTKFLILLMSSLFGINSFFRYYEIRNMFANSDTHWFDRSTGILVGQPICAIQTSRIINRFYYSIGEKATSQWVHSPRRCSLKMSHAHNFNVKENDFYSLCPESSSIFSKVMKSSQLVDQSLLIVKNPLF